MEKVDESWLNKRFHRSSVPNWTCPTCNAATLSLIDDFLERPSERLQKIPEFEFNRNTGEEYPIYEHHIEGLKTRFIGFLRCNSKNCGEFVAISGITSTEQDYYEDPIEGPGCDLQDFYYPYNFNPPIQYFKIPNQYPETIKELLRTSFQLYWIDNSACANKLRTTVENVLDLKKIPRKKRGSKGLQVHSLHKRLLEFQNKKKQIADIFLSIKWIGNEGSHRGNLWNRHLIEAFDLIKLALDLLYVNKDEEILKISKAINKRKGPIQ